MKKFLKRDRCKKKKKKKKTASDGKAGPSKSRTATKMSREFVVINSAVNNNL